MRTRRILMLGLLFVAMLLSACWRIGRPSARFEFEPDGGRAPLRVSLDASGSTDPDGHIESYAWEFGDGQEGVGVGTEHVYETPGMYPIILEVIDDKGNKDSVSKTITVTQAPEIYAALVAYAGICTPGNLSCDSSRAVGPPDAPLGETSVEYHVSLGSSSFGYITAFMSDPFTDGPGPDLRVYEVGDLQGGIDEAFSVYIREGEGDWISVASGIKNDPGSVFASIDISPHKGEYVAVKISNRGEAVSDTPGADIDAVQALYGI